MNPNHPDRPATNGNTAGGTVPSDTAANTPNPTVRIHTGVERDRTTFTSAARERVR